MAADACDSDAWQDYINPVCYLLLLPLFPISFLYPIKPLLSDPSRAQYNAPSRRHEKNRKCARNEEGNREAGTIGSR